MSVITDYPDWSPHVAHADQIAATGVPLLGKPTTLVPSSQVTMGPGAIKSFGVRPLAQVGYRAQFDVTFPAAATNPFIEVNLSWSDSATNTVVDNDYFYLPGAVSPAVFQAYGTGPAKADQVELKITNLDLAQQVTFTTVLLQESMLTSTDKWTWYNAADNGVTVPGFTLPVLPKDQSVLGVFDALNIPASSSKPILCGMAPGRLVNLAGNTAGISPGLISINVTPKPDSAYTPNGTVLRASLTTAAFQFQFIAPAAPLEAIWNNNATSGTLIVTGMMTAQTP